MAKPMFSTGARAPSKRVESSFGFAAPSSSSAGPIFGNASQFAASSTPSQFAASSTPSQFVPSFGQVFGTSAPSFGSNTVSAFAMDTSPTFSRSSAGSVFGGTSSATFGGTSSGSVFGASSSTPAVGGSATSSRSVFTPSSFPGSVTTPIFVPSSFPGTAPAPIPSGSESKRTSETKLPPSLPAAPLFPSGGPEAKLSSIRGPFSEGAIARGSEEVKPSAPEAPPKPSGPPPKPYPPELSPYARNALEILKDTFIKSLKPHEKCPHKKFLDEMLRRLVVLEFVDPIRLFNILYILIVVLLPMVTSRFLYLKEQVTKSLLDLLWINMEPVVESNQKIFENFLEIFSNPGMCYMFEE